jgi:pilus assembly protein CpaB
VEPGDRVDVVGVFPEPRTREMVATTMLQNVIVLATGRISGQTNRRLLSESERAYNTVTLHVLPEAAEMLILAQELGQIYLTLRSPDDNEIYDLGDGRTTMTTLLTGERAKELSRTQSKIFKVEIIRGRHTEMQAVP